MMREALLARISGERERQFNLPGREFDGRNTINDWNAIIGHYVFEPVRRGVSKPSRDEYEDSLVKAAAVILAALEHCTIMEARQNFSQEKSLDKSSEGDYTG